MSIARSESENRKIKQERDHLGEECKKLMQDKAALEERIRRFEVLVQSMGMSAFQQAMQTLKDAFDQAPIPRGIRFAPTDVEVFDYLSRKLRGAQEDVGLDRFLVRRLRGVQDADGLIPEVELLKFPRPWHLPGLDVAPDGKGQVGFYFVRPEWRPNERRRRREADMAARDGKPPCWKESCQPTTFDDLRKEYGGKPERRMFRFKLPGTREGPAGEKKEKWKMYEYTLKSDAEMYEDRRNGLPVWVICKVVREGPMTIDEIEEHEERMGGSGFPGNGNGNFFNGSLGRGFGVQDGSSSSGTGGSGVTGSGHNYGGGFGGGAMQYGLMHAGGEVGEGVKGSGVSLNPKTLNRGLIEWLQSVPPPPALKDRRLSGLESNNPKGLAALLQNVLAGRVGGERERERERVTPVAGWMAGFPDAQKVVGALLEDFFVSKLVVKLRPVEKGERGGERGERGGERGERGLQPPSWRRALTDEDWKRREGEGEEEEEELPPEDSEEEDSETECEFDEEDGSFKPISGSELDSLATNMLTEVKNLSNALAASSEKEISGRLKGFLSQTSVVLSEFISQAGRDEPAAQLWLESLQDSLSKVRAVIESLAGDSQSRIFLLVKSPEMAIQAQTAVRRLAHVLSLLPNVHLDFMSADVRRQLGELKGAMVSENFAPMASTVKALSKLLQIAVNGGKLGGQGEDEKGEHTEKVEKNRDFDFSTDDIAGIKALNQLKEALLGFSNNSGPKNFTYPSPVMSNLVIEVFSLVGVEWDSSAVEIELERLEKVSEGEKKKKIVVKNVKKEEEEDAALAEGVIALLKAFSSGGAVTNMEQEEMKGVEKKGKAVDFDIELPLPAPLVYSCRVFSQSEVDSVQGERVQDVLSGNLNGVPVSLVYVDQNKVSEIALHREVEAVAAIRHPNIASLIGCCPESACLVYEKLPPGSLEDYLQQSAGTPRFPEIPLSWSTRFRIIHEIASALAFLHDRKVLHRDVRPANIMIGWESPQTLKNGPKNWPVEQTPGATIVSKLARVGVAALGREHEPGKTPMDVDGLYLDPAFARSECFFVPAADVYALGVIMAQLLTGRHPPSAVRAVASAFDGGRKTVQSVLDGRAGEWPLREAEEVARAAWRCSMLERAARPELKEVLPALAKVAANC